MQAEVPPACFSGVALLGSQSTLRRAVAFACLGWDCRNMGVPGCRGVPHAAGVLGKTVPISVANPPAAFSTVFQITLLSPNNAALQMAREDPWGSAAPPLLSCLVLWRKRRRGIQINLPHPLHCSCCPAPLLFPLHSLEQITSLLGSCCYPLPRACVCLHPPASIKASITAFLCGRGARVVPFCLLLVWSPPRLLFRCLLAAAPCPCSSSSSDLL